MWNRALVFIGLALCGFFIGTTLETELEDSPKKVLTVGENLIGASLSPNGSLLAGIGRQESGAWFINGIMGLEEGNGNFRYFVLDWTGPIPADTGNELSCTAQLG